MDENGRVCLGMKETVTVQDRDGKSVKHQKRLVLSNLKELHFPGVNLTFIGKLNFLHLLPCHQSGCVLAGPLKHILFVYASTTKILRCSMATFWKAKTVTVYSVILAATTTQTFRFSMIPCSFFCWARNGCRVACLFCQ